MGDRPTIFSAPMVRALLDGRKTQTRRVLNPQPKVPFKNGQWYAPFKKSRQFQFIGRDHLIHGYCNVPYAPGDRLYVREAMHWTDNLRFVADDAVVDFDRMPEGFTAARTHVSGMFMPRWASRLTLTVTKVRVQRLQEITEADAYAEGAMRWGADGPQGSIHYTVREDFARLWNSLHGAGGWDANPWVCALTFTVRTGNIDSGEGVADAVAG